MRAYGKIKVARDAGRGDHHPRYPERRNAIGPLMSNELLWALEDAREAADVRAIVLTGEGNAFCAGGDFAEMAARRGGVDARAQGRLRRPPARALPRATSRWSRA